MHPYSYTPHHQHPHPHQPSSHPPQSSAITPSYTSLEHAQYSYSNHNGYSNAEQGQWTQQQQGGVVWVAEEPPRQQPGGGGWEVQQQQQGAGAYGGQEQYAYLDQPPPQQQRQPTRPPAVVCEPYPFPPPQPPVSAAPPAHSSLLANYAAAPVPVPPAPAPPLPSLQHPTPSPFSSHPPPLQPSPYAAPSPPKPSSTHLQPTYPFPSFHDDPGLAGGAAGGAQAAKKRRVSFAVAVSPVDEIPPPLALPSGGLPSAGAGAAGGTFVPYTPAPPALAPAPPPPPPQMGRNDSLASAASFGSLKSAFEFDFDASGGVGGGAGSVAVKDEEVDDLAAGVAGAGVGVGIGAGGQGAGEGAAGRTKIDRAEKSCKNCRARKVRCSRTWPACQRCVDRKLECHYGNFVPIDLVKNMNPDTRVAELEARIKSLELDLATSASLSRPSHPPHPSSHPHPSSFHPLPPSQQPLSLALLSALHSPLSTFSVLGTPAGRVAHARAVLTSVVKRAAKAAAQGGARGEEDGPGSFSGTGFGPPTGEGGGGGAGSGVGPSAFPSSAAAGEENGGGEEPADAREWRAFKRLADDDGGEAEGMLGVLDGLEGEDERDKVVEGWMSEGRWARWVVWGCLDAFWSTCSSNIPTFRMFHAPSRKLRLYTSLDALPPPERVIVCAFAAVGIRGWADLALLGLGGASAGEADERECGEGEEDLPAGAGPGPSSNGGATGRKDPSLAVQRELQTRSVRGLMLHLFDELEVGVGEGTVGALEASVVCGSVMMWNELIPRRSRTFVRTSLAMYRDLIDSFSAAAAEAGAEGDDERKERMEAEVVETVMMFGLPLLLQDSTTAAYLRSSPLITPSDLATYFSAFALPSFPPSAAPSPSSSTPSSHPAPPVAPADIKDDIAAFADLDRLEGADHMQLLMGSFMVWKWLGGCLRKVAEISCPKAQSTPLPLPVLNSLFTTLSSLHSALQTFQHHFTSLPSIHAHASCLAPGPMGDTCESVHLRWCTRVDREVDDAVWLLYGAVGERMWREQERGAAGAKGAVANGSGVKAEVEEGDEREEMEDVVGADPERLDVAWLEMCESRVRKGLKLAAFYFNLFCISPDPHQTHHIAWQLELIPHWTFLATQRYVPPSPPSLSSNPSDPSGSAPTAPLGLSRKADELTETELDWIEAGLREACKYHPVAEKRLVEVRAYRRGNERRREEGGQVAFPSRATPALASACATTSLTPAFSFLPTPSSSSTTPSIPSTATGPGVGPKQLPLRTGQQKLGFQQAMQVALRMSVPNWA